MKKTTKEAITALLEVIKKDNSHVLIFIGNGISPEELYPINIVEAFLKDMEVREFDSVADTLHRLFEAFDRTKEPPGNYDMGKFIEELNKVEDVKSRFVGHLTRECCKARPTSKHFVVLAFCSLINSLEVIDSEKKPITTIFTTNYDNLIEKVYVKRMDFLSEEYPDKQNQEELAECLFIPAYILDLGTFKFQLEMQEEKRQLPIIPIHGSVRVCKCPSCEEILISEAVAIEEKVCVFCGTTLPPFVIPTEEGKTDKKLLKTLEEDAKDASAIIFIGYGFSDTYLVDRIIRRDPKSPEEKSKPVLINYCREKMKDKLEDKTKVRQINEKFRVFEITQDISESLAFSNTLFSDEVEDSSKSLSALFENKDSQNSKR